MKQSNFTLLTILLVASLFVSACPPKPKSTATSPSQPTVAIVKILLSGTLAPGVKIGGVDVTVTMPAHVTTATTGSTQQATGTAVQASGVAVNSSVIVGMVSAATSTLPAKTRVALVNATGFGLGEVVTLTNMIEAGQHPLATGFNTENLMVSDLTGSIITGITAGLTVDIH